MISNIYTVQLLFIGFLLAPTLSKSVTINTGNDNETYLRQKRSTDQEDIKSVEAELKKTAEIMKAVEKRLIINFAENSNRFNSFEAKLENLTYSNVQMRTEMIEDRETSNRNQKQILNELSAIYKLVQLKKETDNNTHSGRKVSELELTKDYDEQAGGCGGILMGERGKISFQPLPLLLPSNPIFVCIWTVRANLKTEVSFKLTTNNLGSNAYITLTPLRPLSKTSNNTLLMDPTKILKSSSRNDNEFVLDGPVVFVTLVSNHSSTSSPSFTLNYEGRGSDENSTVQYRHYHHVELQKEINYPKLRDVENYSSNEITTFTINPPLPSFNLRVDYVDVESHSECKYDSLTFLQMQKSEILNYIRVANFKLRRDFRYCMEDTDLNNQTVSSSTGSELAYIVVFKSDESKERKGFRFSWPTSFYA